MSIITAVSFSLLIGSAVHKETSVSNGPLSYLIGGIVALLILGYLVYTLLRPDKF
jgi:K+-transporting ATPase KdpF subunit